MNISVDECTHFSYRLLASLASQPIVKQSLDCGIGTRKSLLPIRTLIARTLENGELMVVGGGSGCGRVCISESSCGRGLELGVRDRWKFIANNDA